MSTLYTGPRPPSAAIGTLNGGSVALYAEYSDDLSTRPCAVLTVMNLQGQAMSLPITGRALLELVEAGRRVGETVAQMEASFDNLENDDDDH